ncbi:MAG: hypothetical protein M1822_010236 [Bathelium mastoideum]|nr:MAG: hypothetical protein M1822_010236 [Bathelium mastoideum]
MKQQAIPEMYDERILAEVPAATQLSALSIRERSDAKMRLAQEEAVSQSIEPPPPYSVEASPVQPSNSQSAFQGLSHHLAKPVVVPQTTKVGILGGGAYASPFARAYSPSLANIPNPISSQEFLAFIDGLNEAFIPNPAFQVTQRAGNIAGHVPLFPVRWVGTGLQLASGLGSAAMSYGRAKKYMRLANERLFHPRGLKAKIMKAAEMMKTVRYPDPEYMGKLRLPPLSNMIGAEKEAAMAAGDANARFGTEVRPDDPRMRRLMALERYVEPLSFDVAPAERPQSFWKKLGANQAKKQEQKQMRKIMERRREGIEKGKMAKIDEKESEIAGKILWIVIQNVHGQPGLIGKNEIYNPDELHMPQASRQRSASSASSLSSASTISLKSPRSEDHAEKATRGSSRE